MKTTHLSRFQHRATTTTALSLLLPCLCISIATANPITGDLTVEGDIIVAEGTNEFKIRNGTDGVEFWNDDDTKEWIWSYGGISSATEVMRLGPDNALRLFDRNLNEEDAVIVINPGNSNSASYVSPSIMIGGNEALTVANSPSFLAPYFVTLSADNDGSADSFLMGGTFGGSGNIPTTGEGTRMMWYPEKAAFRAGTVSAAAQYYWDESYTGDHSVAIGIDVVAQGIASASFGSENYAIGEYSFTAGINNTAYGYASMAIGEGAYAYGYASTAIGDGASAYGYSSTALGTYTAATAEGSTATGYGTNAVGHSSTALGGFTYASGYASTALGHSTTAYGQVSTSLGLEVNANGFASTALGQFNEGRVDSSNPLKHDSWIGDDKHSVFEVGIGQDSQNRANALTVLQDGSVELGKDTGSGPPLHITANGDVIIAKPQGDISMGDYQ